jgi:uncharacterized protein YbjT (DUF2867 family)
MRSTEIQLPHVEIVKGDLDDVASLDAALKDVDRAFLVPAVDQRLLRWCEVFISAAKRARTKHVVKFSGMGAGLDAQSEIMRLHGKSDDALIRSGLGYTILQPNSFFQNLFWSVQSIKEPGAFYLPVGDARQSLVDVRDIASVAVSALTTTGHEGKIYEITGPESLSMNDVAATFTRVLGRPIQYVAVPLESARTGMLEGGMPAWSADAVTELYGVIATGQYARMTDTVEKITGKKPATFERFARDFKAVFS